MKTDEKMSPAQMYEKYIVQSTFVPWTPILIDLAKPQPGEHVLDMACGTGIVARHLAPIIGKKGKIVGVDISPSMLQVAQTIAKKQGLEAEWIEAKGENTGLPDHSFDLIICQQGLQFFSDRKAGVKEMLRVLKPRGRAVVSVWTSLENHQIWEAVCRSESKHLNIPLSQVSTPWTMGNAKELNILFENAGFKEIEIKTETELVRYPSADTFIELSLAAAVAMMPHLAQDEAKKANLIEATKKDTEHILQEYNTANGLIFPMQSNIVVAKH